MNRNLLVFALILILLGAVSGAYIISFFGLILLIPSLVSASRPPARRPPQGTREEPRRITPPAPPTTTATHPRPEGMYTASLAPPPPPQVFAPPLFPNTMFPSLSPMSSPVQPAKEATGGKTDGKDELVEVGTMLALMKLLFG